MDPEETKDEQYSIGIFLGGLLVGVSITLILVKAWAPAPPACPVPIAAPAVKVKEEACIAWFLETNLKQVKDRICKSNGMGGPTR